MALSEFLKARMTEAVTVEPPKTESNPKPTCECSFCKGEAFTVARVTLNNITTGVKLCFECAGEWESAMNQIQTVEGEKAFMRPPFDVDLAVARRPELRGTSPAAV